MSWRCTRALMEESREPTGRHLPDAQPLHGLLGRAGLVGGPQWTGVVERRAHLLRARGRTSGNAAVVMRKLFERFGALLTPKPRLSRATDDDFLVTQERFTERRRSEPRYLQLARWLDLAKGVSSQSRRRTCAVCGATAVEVTESWIDNDWHGSYRDTLNTLCLEEPHVVTLSESSVSAS